MRFVIYGAGAIGGVFGGHLHEAGYDVALIARGSHLEAIRSFGLRIDTPDRCVTIAVAAFGHPDEIEFTPDTVVVLAMKSQDTEDALRALASVAPPGTRVVSAQNGVANEPAALRYFADVYGMYVVCPAVHIEPGVVRVRSAPMNGILDVGRYPRGADECARGVAAAARAARFDSVARPDIMEWKYAKLIGNLHNAVDALCGRGPRGLEEIDARARDEAHACLAAAAIPFVADEETSQRRGEILRGVAASDPSDPGSSSWQSLARGTGSIEVDYLNGEIVQLGRLHGVPTPVNEALQRLANRAAREAWEPGSVAPQRLLELVLGGGDELSPDPAGPRGR